MFAVEKLDFEGETESLALPVLERVIANFAQAAGIGTQYITRIENSWKSLAHDTSFDRKKPITKEKFIAQTYTDVAFDNVNLQDYRRAIDLDFEVDEYLSKHYPGLESQFLYNFQMKSAVIERYRIFLNEQRRTNSNLRNSEVLAKFVNDTAEEIAANVLQLDNSDYSVEIAKYFIWTFVRQDSTYTKLKEATNYEG